jgi:hypothetical protein
VSEGTTAGVVGGSQALAAVVSAVGFVENSKPLDLDPFDDARLKDIAQERQLRKTVARWTMWGLAVQLVLMDAAFGWYAFRNIGDAGFADTFKWFFAGTLGEIFGIMWVLVAYLFPKNRPSSYGDH